MHIYIHICIYFTPTKTPGNNYAVSLVTVYSAFLFPWGLMHKKHTSWRPNHPQIGLAFLGGAGALWLLGPLRCCLGSWKDPGTSFEGQSSNWKLNNFDD